MRSIEDYEVIHETQHHLGILGRNNVLYLGNEAVARFKHDKGAWAFVADLVKEGHVFLDEFTTAYIESIMGSVLTASDDDCESGRSDLDIDAFDTDGLAEILMDCQNFLNANEEMIADDESRAGHDFCMTRNREGCGFWDGDWPEPDATQLTDASHTYGTQGLMLSEDGKTLYVHN